MSVKKDFEIGDLVWAKMKGFPHWPAKIVQPPTAAPPKKAHNYVYFFGSEDHAWILDSNIVYHSKEMYQSAAKKKSASFKLALEQLSRESESVSKNAKLPVKEKGTPRKSPKMSTSNNEGKLTKIHKSNVKTESPEVQKKIAPRRRFIVTSANKRTSSPLKSAPKKTKSPVNKKESPRKSEVSAGSTERKITKVQKAKVKTLSPKDQKKTASKRRFLGENGIASPPRKLSKKSEDFSAIISNTPTSVGDNRVAVIKPLDDQANSFSSGMNWRELTSVPAWREYIEKRSSLALNFQKTSEVIPAKNTKKIGFIGLGMMGRKIVETLITSGHTVTVWNRTTQKCNYFVTIGASMAQTPGDLIEKCDLIFSCVAGPDAAKSLVFGNCGILSGLEKDFPSSKGYVEMTTIDPITSQEIAEAIVRKGGRYLEAPISGSKQMAENGTLLILCSGDHELFNSCESCFDALSKKALYLGCDVGISSKMNLIHSMLTGISQAAMAEAMAVVNSCKLDKAEFLKILKLACFNSPLLLEKGQSIVDGSADTNTLRNQIKDLGLALSLDDRREQPMVLAAVAKELFKHAKLVRNFSSDNSVEYLRAHC